MGPVARLCPGKGGTKAVRQGYHGLAMTSYHGKPRIKSYSLGSKACFSHLPPCFLKPSLLRSFSFLLLKKHQGPLSEV